MTITTKTAEQGHPDQHNAAHHKADGSNVLLGFTGGTAAEFDWAKDSAPADSVAVRDANGDVIVPTTPTSAQGAVSKQHFDEAIQAGSIWKELLLVQGQLLDGASGGIRPAFVIYSITHGSSQPADGNTLLIKDAAGTETYTFKNTPVGAFDVQIGASTGDTLANLAAAINSDSATWAATAASGLEDYFDVAAGYDTQVVVYRQAAGANNTDRAYGGTFTPSAIWRVQSFDGTVNYTEGLAPATVALGTSDPAANYAGFGRALASLQIMEAHRVAEDNSAWNWDEDDQVWQQSDVGAFSGGDGVDLTAGVLSVDLATDPGLEFDGGTPNKLRAKADETTIERVAGGLRVKDASITLAKLADQKTKIALAGTTPVLSDLGSLSADGNWAFAYGTDESLWFCAAVNPGTGVNKYSVQMTEITS